MEAGLSLMSCLGKEWRRDSVHRRIIESLILMMVDFSMLSGKRNSCMGMVA